MTIQDAKGCEKFSPLPVNESTPEAMGQDIVFPTLPHGLSHIGEIIAVIRDVIDARQAEAAVEEETQALQTIVSDFNTEPVR